MKYTVADGCAGDAGMSAIHDGAAIVFTLGGREVASGIIGNNQILGNLEGCTYTFAVDGLQPSASYSVTLAGLVEWHDQTVSPGLPLQLAVTASDIVGASPSPSAGLDLQDLKQTIQGDVEDALDYEIDRVQKVTVSENEIHVEYGDSNWVKSILKQNQWTAVEAIAEEIFDYGDYWNNIRPTITLRGNSALGGGSLTSVTTADQLEAIYNLDMSETDWYQQASFTVKGRLY